MIKPNFFGVVARKKGYYDGKKKCYQFHQTTMDYVQHTINRLRLKLSGCRPANKPFSYIVDPVMANTRNAWYPQVEKIISAARDCAAEVAAVHNSTEIEPAMKYEIGQSIRKQFADYISGVHCNSSTMYVLLKMLDKDEMSDIRQTLFGLLFGCANSSFYNMIEESREPFEIAVECLSGEISLYGYSFTAHTVRNDPGERGSDGYLPLE